MPFVVADEKWWFTYDLNGDFPGGYVKPTEGIVILSVNMFGDEHDQSWDTVECFDGSIDGIWRSNQKYWVNLDLGTKTAQNPQFW